MNLLHQMILHSRGTRKSAPKQKKKQDWKHAGGGDALRQW